MTLLVNILGLAAAAFIVWWFWLSKNRPEAKAGDSALDIIVDGGVYEPSVIRAGAGKPLRLRFLRKDKNPCAEKVIFSGLDVSADLPLGQPREIVFTPASPGEYEFTCQMAMYRGKLIVEPGRE
jgi:plastocyanin domain-containing protein